MAFVKTHLPCDDCGSSDGLSLNDNGWTHCFVCDTRKHQDNDRTYTKMETKAKPLSEETQRVVNTVQPRTIIDRGINADTCKTYRCYVEMDGTTTFAYTDEDGHVVAVKKRTADKRFSVEGSWADATLYGQDLFSKGGKFVTIVEGEYDAMAAYQMMGSKWPVVSIKSGAGSAIKDIRKAYEWLDSFESIVICFDNDEAGKKAVNQVCEVFGSKIKVMRHSKDMKDACDYLASKRWKEFTDNWWGAEAYVPDGIIAASTLRDEVMKPIEAADVLYPFAELNKLTYGLRKGELVTVTAGSGLGKSQFLREIIYHVFKETEDNIGLLFLEESSRKTGLSIMSLEAGKALHLPDCDVSDEEKQKAFDNTLGTERFYMFGHFGSTGVDNIISRVRHLAKGLGCKYIFLDHISIVVSAQASGDERKAIDEIMTKLRMLVEETGVSLVCVSHLKRPDGKGHEEGSATSLSQLRGSGSIAQLSDMVIGLERNGQAEDMKERNTTSVRVLKNRFCGITGPAGRLLYSHDSGRMFQRNDEEEL